MSEAGGRRTTIVKRSLTIAGHRTSISLEDAFWVGLKVIADTRGQSVATIVAEVDRTRGNGNLSSALRVMVLESLAGSSLLPRTAGMRSR